MSLFISDKEMLKKIRRASNGKVSMLDDLSRDEAFSLLREIANQNNITKEIQHVHYIP